MNVQLNNPLLKTHWFNHSTNQWVLRDKNAYRRSLQNKRSLLIQVIRNNTLRRIAEQKTHNDIEAKFLKSNNYINF
jgi:hypothetical protein